LKVINHYSFYNRKYLLFLTVVEIHNNNITHFMDTNKFILIYYMKPFSISLCCKFTSSIRL